MNQRLIKYFFLGLAILFSTGCHRPIYVWEEEAGEPKPAEIQVVKLALIPVVNECEQFHCGWNLSREMTLAIRDELSKLSQFCLLSKDEVEGQLGLMPQSYLFHFEALRKNVLSYFGCADYVALFEILEHQTTPYAVPKAIPFSECEESACGWVLTMKMRVVVLQVRDRSCPAVVDQIICCSHPVPRDEECFDYCEDCWGTHPYAFSPFFLCHERIAKNIASLVAARCLTRNNNL